MGLISLLVAIFSLNVSIGLGPVTQYDDSCISAIFVDVEYNAVIPYRSHKNNNFFIEEGFKPDKDAIRKVNHMPIDLLNRQITKAMPESMQIKAKDVIEGVLVISNRLEIDPIFLLSTIWTESSFKSKNKSHRGAKGYMQLMPITKKFLKRIINKNEYEQMKESLITINLSDDSKENIILGAYYLKLLKKQFKDSNVALAAYNMGPTWTKQQLLNNKKIGYSNEYVNKIRKNYLHISNKLSKM
jgi:soluble lytic murein transglycosylase